MIRHCVWVKFRSDVGADERASIYADLAALKDRVPGLERASFGPNVSPEGLGQGFADGFTMDFADAGARDAYLVHPDHQAAGARLVAAAEGGLAGILVFDIEV
ncbi:Dabb family protein [Paradevosia shaoguanensis]|uniref:Dabb family protein n=1 Tax=Paradevosia shaoguanensis TaxID=1335043 RepID=UPI0019343A0F|nr:Dabb family protein [Paradevosia shaoguanensis]